MARGLNMTDSEITGRLAGIKRYNEYFKAERDDEGKPLTHHKVSHRHLHRIMTREWGVADTTKFGIAVPEPLPDWNGKIVPAALPPIQSAGDEI